MRRAIFLDRDGVLNHTIFRDGKPRAPYRIEDFILFAGVKEALELLSQKKYLLIVVTNQPDVARGWVTREAVDAVNEKLQQMVHVDEIKVCFHTEKDDCSCRKPRPGMLLEAARDWQIDLKNSYMIGDRYSDVEAGNTAGCRTFLIGKGDTPGMIRPDFQKNSLLEAARIILMDD